MSRNNRAACYARVSKSLQKEKYGLPAQITMMGDYCREHDYDIITTFREVHTGAELDERLELSELRYMMAHGEIDILVVNELDRLAREQNHQAVIAYEADKYGVRIENVVGPKWQDDPMGKYIMSTIAMMAEMEREHIRDRTQRGIRQKIKEGHIPGYGRAHYGYRWGDEKHRYLEVHPDTGAVVIRIFEEVATGTKLRTLCLKLVDEGVPCPMNQYYLDAGKSPTNAAWKPKTITAMIDNPVYTGTYIAFRRRYYKRREHDRLAGVVRGVHTSEERKQDDPLRVELTGVAPRLVPDTLARAAQERLRQNQIESARSNKHPQATLLRGGLATCGKCGSNMRQGTHTFNKDGVLTFVYVCSKHNWTKGACHNSARAATIDAVIWDGVRRVLQEIDIYAEAVRLRASEPDFQDNKVAAYEQEVTSIDAEQADIGMTLVGLRAEAARKALVDRSNMLDKRRESLVRAIAKEKESSGHTKEALRRLESVSTWASYWAGKIDTMDYETKRLVLRVMGLHAVIHPAGSSPRVEVYTRTEFAETFFAAPIISGPASDPDYTFAPSSSVTLPLGQKWPRESTSIIGSLPCSSLRRRRVRV